MRSKVRPRCSESTGRELESRACEDAGVGLSMGHSVQPAPFLPLLWPHPEVVLFITLQGAHCCPRAGSGWWSSILEDYLDLVSNGGILTETGYVNKNHFAYPLSLCCVIGQIRNVCGLKFKLSMVQHRWKRWPTSWERHLSLNECRLGPEKAAQLSLGWK